MIPKNENIACDNGRSDPILSEYCNTTDPTISNKIKVLIRSFLSLNKDIKKTTRIVFSLHLT